VKEIWKDIPGYEGLYQASDLGRIKRVGYEYYGTNQYNCKYKIKKKEKILIPRLKNNYLGVILTKNKNKKNWLVHRLVALTFVDNPHKYNEINHKDENPLNNSFTNLEWCSHSYNINYGSRIQKVISKVCKPILQYDLDGNFIKEWNTMNEAIRFYNNRHISNVCKKQRKTASGYIWCYKYNKNFYLKES
jgi:hypothetical protein